MSSGKAKGWLCGNCGHEHEATESLEELGFIWYENGTSKTSCRNCGSYTLQRAYTWDAWGHPIAGQFLLVKSFNKIRKGTKRNEYRPKKRN